MKTQYYSETLNKHYDTKEECLKAEKAYDEEQLKIKKEKEMQERRNKELATTRKERATAVDEAYKKVAQAKAEADKLLTEYLKDYGVYYKTEFIKSPISNKEIVKNLLDIENLIGYFFK